MSERIQPFLSTKHDHRIMSGEKLEAAENSSAKMVNGDDSAIGDFHTDGARSTCWGSCKHDTRAATSIQQLAIGYCWLTQLPAYTQMWHTDKQTKEWITCRPPPPHTHTHTP